MASNHHFGWDPDAREVHRDEPWLELAVEFAGDWDQMSFDPDVPPPLSLFDDRLRAVFSEPRVTE